MGSFSFAVSGVTETVFMDNAAINFSEHSHSDNFVVSAVLRGTAFTEKNGCTFSVAAGGVFTVFPYEAHAFYSLGNVTAVSLCINKSAVYESESAEIGGWAERALLPLCLTEEMLRLITSRASYLGNEHYRELPEPYRQGIEYTENFPENELCLDELAERAYVSKFHFLREFKKNAGLSPNKFRLFRRIRMSQRLLREGKSVTEAAVQTGFYDQSHFDRYFKKVVGVTPSEYIRSVSNFLQA
ncbi:MAG: AraC family transcriptional regulator [Ruminococcus sp.]|nr:AraC family transcriptional regulator [Ruminococcus sp.]